MSDFFRKDYNKKRGEFHGKDSSRGRGPREKDGFKRMSTEKTAPAQPTILIKSRESDRASSPGVATSSKKEPETSYQIQTKPTSFEAIATPQMPSSMPFFNAEMTSLQELCQEFLSDHSDFLVVGCLGLSGVGKSTVMSLLAQPNATPLEKSIFNQQTAEDAKNIQSITRGIGFYVTSNRIILLDCQPILPLDTIIHAAEEGNEEIRSLKLAAFLFSICHVVLFVQDYFLDPDLIRFLQTAEMLKPSTSTAIGETMVEYFPHLVFIHNRADDWDFEAQRVKEIQESYLKCFAHSRLQIQTGFGIAFGDVSPVLDTTSCGPLVNVFLLPKITNEEPLYSSHPSFKDLFRHLRNQILSTPRTPISHALLSEKNWFLYAAKVWEGINKSSFFKEYHRLISNI